MVKRIKSFRLYGFHSNPAVEYSETWAVTSLLLFTLIFVNIYNVALM